MALTMTRTRTQTALTKLAQMVAEVHGELAALERLAREYPDHAEMLERRGSELLQKRDALYLTLKQFDPDIDAATIGESDEWLRAYGRRDSKATLRRYLLSLQTSQDTLCATD